MEARVGQSRQATALPIWAPQLRSMSSKVLAMLFLGFVLTGEFFEPAEETIPGLGIGAKEPLHADTIEGLCLQRVPGFAINLLDRDSVRGDSLFLNRFDQMHYVGLAATTRSKISKGVGDDDPVEAVFLLVEDGVAHQIVPLFVQTEEKRFKAQGKEFLRIVGGAGD